MEILKAPPGKLLTNGVTTGKIVYLSIYDKPENWKEIQEEKNQFQIDRN